MEGRGKNKQESLLGTHGWAGGSPRGSPGAGRGRGWGLRCEGHRAGLRSHEPSTGASTSALPWGWCRDSPSKTVLRAQPRPRGSGGGTAAGREVAAPVILPSAPPWHGWGQEWGLPIATSSLGDCSRCCPGMLGGPQSTCGSTGQSWWGEAASQGEVAAAWLGHCRGPALLPHRSPSPGAWHGPEVVPAAQPWNRPAAANMESKGTPGAGVPPASGLEIPLLH